MFCTNQNRHMFNLITSFKSFFYRFHSVFSLSDLYGLYVQYDDCDKANAKEKHTCLYLDIGYSQGIEDLEMSPNHEIGEHHHSRSKPVIL